MTPDTFDWLFSLGQFGIKFGLHNIHALTHALGEPQRQFRSVHIAGTNGKGSVTAMTETALRIAGFKTGRYTSPHLLDLAERFAVNGEPVSTDTLHGALARVRDATARLQADGTLEVSPTFFEVTTALAFELFRQEDVDVAVCEVGLGGRLDATNVLEPVACAITSIGFDHEQYLGHSLPLIAAEKAGIIKPGTPVVVGAVSDDVQRVFESTAAAVAAPLIWAQDGVKVRSVVESDTQQTFSLSTPSCDYGRLSLSLPGDHQVGNAVVAVRLLEVLSSLGLACSPAHIAEALSRVSWPGRLQHVRLDDGRTILLDAAHNASGAEALARHLTRRGEPRPLVFAAMKDKNSRAMLEWLAPHASRIVMTRASNPRSDDPAQLAATARAIRPDIAVEVADSVDDALARAWFDARDIVAAGSIFLLADVLRSLRRP